MKVTTDSCLFGAWCAAEIRDHFPGLNHLMDIGTGSGLLSLMVAQKNPVQVDAVEIDDEAASQAGENFKNSPWDNRLQVIHGDILSFPTGHKYDVIISNPPFYEKELASPHPNRNLAHHSSGLNLSQLLPLIKNALTAEGRFFLLLPYKRLEETREGLAELDLYIHQKVLVRQTTAHKEPFRIMIRGGLQKGPALRSELAIMNEKREYTPEFIALLQDYYLYL